MPSESQKIFSVGELNENVHRLISGQLKNIFVKGEISNLSQPASGHVYFVGHIWGVGPPKIPVKFTITY